MQGMHEISAHIERSVLASSVESPVVVASSEIKATVVEVEDVSVELLIVEVVFDHDEDVPVEGLVWVCGVDHLVLLDSQLVCEDEEEGYQNKFHIFLIGYFQEGRKGHLRVVNWI